jgi:hypothetical protein
MNIGFNKELKSSVEALQAKVLKYKKDSRDYASEALGQQNTVKEKEGELKILKKSKDDIQASLGHAHKVRVIYVCTELHAYVCLYIYIYIYTYTSLSWACP